MFFQLDCRQGAPSSFRPESRQGNHRSKGHKLCFVATSQSPAVLASIRQALNKFQHWPWWHGPKWLQDGEETWPPWHIPEITKDTLEEIESKTKGPNTLDL